MSTNGKNAVQSIVSASKVNGGLSPSAVNANLKPAGPMIPVVQPMNREVMNGHQLSIYRPLVPNVKPAASIVALTPSTSITTALAPNSEIADKQLPDYCPPTTAVVRTVSGSSDAPGLSSTNTMAKQQQPAHSVPAAPAIGTFVSASAGAKAPITPAPQDKSVPKSPPVDAGVKKPRSPYNLFFLVERQLVMDKLHPATSTLGKHESYIEDAIPSPAVPIRYRKRGIANPLIVVQTGRRKHRKVHGKIGFVELCREIANRWKKADNDTKNYFKALSQEDLLRFKNDLTAMTHRAALAAKIEFEEMQRKTQSTPVFASMPLHTLPKVENKATSEEQPKGAAPCFVQPFSQPSMNENNQIKSSKRELSEYDKSRVAHWKRTSATLPAQGNVPHSREQKRTKTELDVARSLVANGVCVPQIVAPSNNRVKIGGKDTKSTKTPDHAKDTPASGGSNLPVKKRTKAELDVARSLIESALCTPQTVTSSDTPVEEQQENKDVSPKDQGENKEIPRRDNRNVLSIPKQGKNVSCPQANVVTSNGMGLGVQQPMPPVMNREMQFGGLPVPVIPPGLFHPALPPSITSMNLPWERQLDLYRVYLQTLFEHQQNRSNERSRSA